MVGFSRRYFLGTAAAGIACSAMRPAFARARVFAHAAALGTHNPVAPALLRRAVDALDQHRQSIDHPDVIGIADFSLPSNLPRFYLVNLVDGRVAAHLVAHGRGSDPEHTGWLERFSNEPRSEATSAGAYRTECLYVGGHGHSMRLGGLDASNSNAATRAIVVHGAWYVSEEIAKDRGLLGRSEGCLAVAQSSLDEVLTTLGPGRLIYAGKA